MGMVGICCWNVGFEDRLRVDCLGEGEIVWYIGLVGGFCFLLVG